jgi:hypothetical protein
MEVPSWPSGRVKLDGDVLVWIEEQNEAQLNELVAAVQGAMG